MDIYQKNPAPAPDSDFVPGALDLLVVGNQGRVLDPRRTPVSVESVRPHTGEFVLRVEGFEDKGALWEVPVEEVHHYQFAVGSARAGKAAVRALEAARDQFDRTIELPADPEARTRTQAELELRRAEALDWFRNQSRFLRSGGALPDPDTRTGAPLLYEDLESYMESAGLGEMERAFAGQFVSNPYSGEIVKGHRMVLAEMGLVAYADKVLRNPDALRDAWSRERRRDHILHRLGFTWAMLHAVGRPSPVVYRGTSRTGPLQPARNNTFVSTSFSRAVAQAHFDAEPGPATRLLASRPAPPERVFMTYLETRAMNRQFLEAEAVLLYADELPF